MSAVHTERKPRRTVLVLALACAVTWLFAVGHSVTGAVGSEPAVAGAGCQGAVSCVAAPAPGYNRAGAPATVQSVPVGATTSAPLTVTP